MSNEQTQNASMEDILSSIRSIVKEEATKPLVQNTAKSATNDAEEDVLELTDVIEEGQSSKAQTADLKEEFVDVNAFAQTGEVKAASDDKDKINESKQAVAEEQKNTPSTEELMAEMKAQAEEAKSADKADEQSADQTGQESSPEPTEQPQTEASEADEVPKAEAAEEKPNNAEPEPAKEDDTDKPQADEAEAAPKAEPAKSKRPVSLKAIPAAQGLQVAFPVEVLAEALRPMIKDWVEENLPTIVEKLVREELSRLVDNEE